MLSTHFLFTVWLGRVGGGARDVDAARRPPVDDFDGGDSGGGRVLITPVPLLLLLLNVRCTLFKKQQQTNSRVAMQTNLINSCRYYGRLWNRADHYIFMLWFVYGRPI